MQYDFTFNEYEADSFHQNATVIFGDLKWSISFYNGEVGEILTEDGSYIDGNEAHKFFVKDGFKICNLKNLIVDIEKNYDDYANSEKEEIQAEIEMRNELSSPSMTGRI